MRTLLLFIAPDDRLDSWWIVEAGAVTARGDADTVLPDDLPDRVVAVAPAAATTIHIAQLGGLATQQARTAARLLVADASVVPIDTQHVAIGEANGSDRAVAVIGNGRIAAWLDQLRARGVDPGMILSAPLLLPMPEDGFVRAAIGGETVLRARSAAFADEAGLTELLVAGAHVEDVDGEPLILAALDRPELDLLQGRFAGRSRFRIDGRLARRLVMLAGAIAVATCLIAIVQIARYSLGARALETQAEVVARNAAPGRGGDPVAALQARLAARRGSGLGFTATAGALSAAVRAVPNVELAAIDFDSDGLLRATVIAPGPAEAETLRTRLRNMGLAVEATPFQGENGRIRGEFRIGRR